MKKAIFTIAILSFVLTMNAQNNGGSFGLKAGVSSYKISNYDDNVFSNRRAGFHGGVFYKLPVGSMFSIQPELLYSSEGIVYIIIMSDIIEAIDYINLPIMLQVNMPSGLFFETGPQVGYLLNAKVKGDSFGGPIDDDIKSFMRKTALSWGAGAGYMFGNFGIGGRYNFGLSKLYKDDDGSKSRSNGLQISLIMRLGK